MNQPNWRRESSHGSHPTSSHHGIATASAYLAPIALCDGRTYDLCEIRVCDYPDRSQGYEAPRWIVTMEAQERINGDNLLFVSRVMWSAVKRDALHDYSPERGRALTLMARERVEEYLRFHRFPAQCCNQLNPITFEIA